MSTILTDTSFINTYVDTTGYITMENNYILKLQAKFGQTPAEVENATGLKFLRVDEHTDRLHWPLYYKIVDEKKWTMIRLKNSI